MNKPYFIISATVFGTAIIAAAIYLGSPSDTAKSPGSSDATVTRGSAKEQNDVESQQPEGQVLDIGPLEAYSSNPPKHPEEQQILELMRDRETSDQVKVQQLLAMAPRFSGDGRLLAVEHAAKLIPDTDYVKHRPRLLQLANSPELREVVLADVLTRDDSVRMPSLVELLRQPANESHTDVREVLEAYLDHNFGDDVKKWELAVQEYLRENSDS